MRHLRFLPDNTNIDFVGWRYYAFAVDGLLLLVTVHAPNGSPVLVNPENVQTIRRADRGDYPGARAVIVMGSGVQATQESVEELQAICTRKVPGTP